MHQVQLRLQGNTPEKIATSSTARQTVSHQSQRSSIINEGLEEMQNPTQVHACLEKIEFIIPTDCPITCSTLVTAIHHVTNLKNIPRIAISPLRSIALLLEELETNTTNEQIQNTVTTQLNTLTDSLK